MNTCAFFFLSRGSLSFCFPSDESLFVMLIIREPYQIASALSNCVSLIKLQSRLCIRGCVRSLVVGPSVGSSVRHTRVEFLRNGLNSNEIASGIRKYTILKTIQRQVCICCPNSALLAKKNFETHAWKISITL